MSEVYDLLRTELQFEETFLVEDIMEILWTFDVPLWKVTPTYRVPLNEKAKQYWLSEWSGTLKKALARSMTAKCVTSDGICPKLCDDLKPVVHMDALLHSLSANPAWNTIHVVYRKTGRIGMCTGESQWTIILALSNDWNTSLISSLAFFCFWMNLFCFLSVFGWTTKAAAPLTNLTSYLCFVQRQSGIVDCNSSITVVDASIVSVMHCVYGMSSPVHVTMVENVIFVLYIYHPFHCILSGDFLQPVWSQCSEAVVTTSLPRLSILSHVVLTTEMCGCVWSKSDTDREKAAAVSVQYV